MKSKIKAELTSDKAGKKPIIYEGRLLGMIDDEQYSVLLNNIEIQRKFLTMESMDLIDMVDNFEKLEKEAEENKEAFENPRIVILTKMKDGKDCSGSLFVTDKCEKIKGATINGVKGTSTKFLCENREEIEITEFK